MVLVYMLVLHAVVAVVRGNLVSKLLGFLSILSDQPSILVSGFEIFVNAREQFRLTFIAT